MTMSQRSDHLTALSLYAVLQDATSSEQQRIDGASKQLQLWQTSPNYHRFLQEIFSDRSLSFEARWLSAIQLKNGIDRFWRKTAANGIDAEEKARIRSKCIQIGLDEEDSRLALQNALFVAKIIRVDFPEEWPNAIIDILQAVKNSSSRDFGHHQLNAALLLLLTVVKELSTARLSRTKRALYAEGNELLQTILTIHESSFASWSREIQHASGTRPLTLNAMEQDLLCLRNLRRLLVSAFEEPSRNEHVHRAWSLLGAVFEFTMQNIQGQRLYGNSEPYLKPLEKMALQVAKLHVSMIQVHPSSFPQLPNAVSVTKAHWEIIKHLGADFGVDGIQLARKTLSDPEDNPLSKFIEQMALRGLLLLRGCVKMVFDPSLTFKYQTTKDQQEKRDSKQIMKHNLLSESLVKEMMEIIVTRFFVFRPMDLQQWSEDPLEWERQEEGEGDIWKYSVRICAEKLFLDLVLNHKSLLIEPLVKVFSAVASLDEKSVLLKDSIYCAIGLSAPILVGHLDFDTFMSSTLVSELQIEDPAYGILRRRASIMIAQWSNVGGLNSSVVYEIFKFLLDKSSRTNDLVVRITAGRQLKNAIDPYDASFDRFHPHSRVLLQRVMALVMEVDLVETKIALLGTVTFIVQLMAENIIPMAEDVVCLLPQIWNDAADEFLLKQAIICLFSDLFKSMKGESSQYHGLVLPLIANALDEHSEVREYLLDDTIDLWGSLLLQAPASSDDVLKLWPLIFPLFETANENLRRALEITDSYILLSPHAILSDGGSMIWNAVTSLMHQSLRRDARVLVCEVVERLLVVAHSIGGSASMVDVVMAAEAHGFISRIIAGLLQAHQVHQNTSPKGPKTEINGVVETGYWRILARVLLSEPRLFLDLLQRIFTSLRSESPIHLLQDLLTELFSHYDSLNGADASKLIALALAALFNYDEPSVARQMGDRLQDLITVWTAAIHECTYEGKDTLVWNDFDALRPEGVEIPEQFRRRQLGFNDPIRRMNIRDAVASAVKEFSLRSGATFDDCVRNVDRDIMEQFHALDLFRGN